MRRKRVFISVAVAALAILAAGFLLPERLAIPVAGATSADWNHETFWYEPWGASGVHKGIDIFAPEGRPVVAATPGLDFDPERGNRFVRFSYAETGETVAAAAAALQEWER